jgi:hypothetical protein
MLDIDRAPSVALLGHLARTKGKLPCGLKNIKHKKKIKKKQNKNIKK